MGFADGGDKVDGDVAGDELDDKTAVIFQDVFVKTQQEPSNLLNICPMSFSDSVEVGGCLPSKPRLT